jgi:hypothetical protein
MLLFVIFSILEIQTKSLFDLVVSWINTMGKLVNYADYIFFVGTNSYIVCYIIEFRMDNNNSCYAMNCMSIVANVLSD